SGKRDLRGFGRVFLLWTACDLRPCDFRAVLRNMPGLTWRYIQPYIADNSPNLSPAPDAPRRSRA
ncbi:hypothetical protein, partial [Stenotrophomonas maltophilia]|uniref:hypothetical protein n=1 Tax=Stenotrophomonas maltophilia TaxID=40324 RepID=UPI001952E047